MWRPLSPAPIAKSTQTTWKISILQTTHRVTLASFLASLPLSQEAVGISFQLNDALNAVMPGSKRDNFQSDGMHGSMHPSPPTSTSHPPPPLTLYLSLCISSRRT